MDGGFLTTMASLLFSTVLYTSSAPLYETYDDSPFSFVWGSGTLSISWGVSWDLWAWSSRLLHLGPFISKVAIMFGVHSFTSGLG